MQYVHFTGSPILDENFRESETFTLAQVLSSNTAACAYVMEYIMSNVALEAMGLVGLSVGGKGGEDLRAHEPTSQPIFFNAK